MHTVSYEDQIQGLCVIEDFCTPQEEEHLVSTVDKLDWTGLGVGPNPEMKRRTQQYGHLFSYRYRHVKVMQELGPLPDFATPLVARIMEHNLMPNQPNHLLVNEYNLGQGIMPHTDAPKLFGPAILSLSLASPCTMKFTHAENGHEIDVLLPRRSMVVMTSDARYQYKHSISKDHTDTASSGVTVERGKRISFTFRGLHCIREIEKRGNSEL
ncbi:hypothetical protein BCR43DRAFT_431508 [Syncephalastrum racemosum]|uniref:Fe2OG dioxygenase domain-containing protein n=1 Tax=Syncephalastrum racemosum TaxID=13706 RepID=A0A1X2HSA4_SYNRA|nr:hypothetical protein BCR43DRAFT_431508 [Syncephalastrum racemosum]